ncbi:MAG: YraN family protein [Rhodospirillales bacterium]|jgi:putative endonuclease|nr:YraN family protein [Rhodospirillales bacterium]
MIKSNKRADWKRGQLGEMLGALYLRLKGYRILARQYRTPLGEIDIIARRGNTVAFVEVKVRQDHDSAASAISRQQQMRIINAANLFIQKVPNTAECDLRFDALLVAPWRWPDHIQNAWHQ